MIIVGKVGATFGVQGWLKIQSFTEQPASILDYAPWQLSSDQKHWNPVSFDESALQHNTVLVRFEGIHTPEAARLFTGKLIGVPREKLPALPKNEYYWSDLKGLTVIDQHGHTLGQVVSLMETGSNDVLVVKGDKEIAIPYLPQKVILSVDLIKREIHVDWEPI